MEKRADETITQFAMRQIEHEISSRELEILARRFEWDRAMYSGAAIAAIIRERINNGIR